MRVLLIDDDPFALRLLVRQLAQLGIDDVQTAGSAQAALDTLQRQRFAFDVLFCDLNMPNMDGVELLRHLARHQFPGGLVLISGEDERILQSVAKLASARKLRLLGAVRKPVSIARLKSLLGETAELQVPATRPLRKIYAADELRDAIAAGQLVNHYQPQVDFATGDVTGMETLVRWRHPDDGLVAPDQFIATAEQARLIGALARAVLTNALAQAAQWRALGIGARLAINMSMDNLVALDFPDQVERAGAAAGVPTSHLVLEVTESQLMRERSALLDIVARLRLKGIGLSIDDFGTGFSSLAQLRDIPFDELKLDRSFVHGAWSDAPLRAILQANLAMARDLGLRTVAEGVEDRNDWNCLRELGCDLAQGYFIARPMPADDVIAWLHDWQGRRQELTGAPR